MARSAVLARRLYERFEPVHGIVYFAPEARAAVEDLGYRGFWRGYFATRSAPLGRADARVVQAIFYNFASFRPNTAAPFGRNAELRTATQTILHDAAYPSTLTLPVIPAGDPGTETFPMPRRPDDPPRN
ncbi:Probable peptidase [Mycobacteroides abscessus]|nr:Probable peptidase [Mycobacteroides abscessus]